MKFNVLDTFAGAGGFIGGHLVKNLLNEGHDLVCADLKPIELWFQSFEKCSNYSLDLKEYENCLKVTSGILLPSISFLLWLLNKFIIHF